MTAGTEIEFGQNPDVIELARQIVEDQEAEIRLRHAADFVGLFGATGAVTGAHLHHEIQVIGANVDPFAWLQANAGLRAANAG